MKTFRENSIWLLFWICYWFAEGPNVSELQKSNLYKDWDFSLLSYESVLLFEDATGKSYPRWKTPHQSTSNNPPTMDEITCECLWEINVSVWFLSAKGQTYFCHYGNIMDSCKLLTLWRKWGSTISLNTCTSSARKSMRFKHQKQEGLSV